MTNQLHDMLSHWLKNKDSHQWVLGTIVETQGSSYRKTGAMLLINNVGQYFGLLSGGCLEADIMLKAQQVINTKQAKTIQYDMLDDDDISWKLGIGCGGLVKIVLQPINAANNYHQLIELHQALQAGKHVCYEINLNDFQQENKLHNTIVKSHSSTEKLILNLAPVPRIAIFGAGIDCRPLVALAGTLGWHITLIDHRTSNGRSHFFPAAHQIIKQHPNTLTYADFLQHIDAAVIMGHNIEFDAAALALCQTSSSRYVGLLGPVDRKEKVFIESGINHLSKPLSAPIGLDLGGQLPESIALAILAEVHACLENKTAQPLSSNTALTKMSLVST